MQDVSPLFRWLLKDLPVEFLYALLRMAPRVYAEAHARTYRDPLFGKDWPTVNAVATALGLMANRDALAAYRTLFSRLI